MIRHQHWSSFIALFPVSKYQFEHFMAEGGPRGNLYTDEWYRKLLEGNPRRSWRQCGEKQWQLFMTGVDHGEMLPFLKYLGRGFRLPTVEEWRKLFSVSDDLLRMQSALIKACEDSQEPHAAPPVSVWIEKGLFPLVREGLLEMVISGNTELLVGRPFQGFQENLFDPEDTRPLNRHNERCLEKVGFRTVDSCIP